MGPSARPSVLVHGGKRVLPSVRWKHSSRNGGRRWVNGQGSNETNRASTGPRASQETPTGAAIAAAPVVRVRVVSAARALCLRAGGGGCASDRPPDTRASPWFQPDASPMPPCRRKARGRHGSLRAARGVSSGRGAARRGISSPASLSAEPPSPSTSAGPPSPSPSTGPPSPLLSRCPAWASWWRCPA